MALLQDTYVHMETVEETKNKDEKSYENGDAKVLRSYGGK